MSVPSDCLEVTVHQPRTRPADSERLSVEGFEEFEIATAGTTIHGRRGGHGPPVLPLHSRPLATPGGELPGQAVGNIRAAEHDQFGGKRPGSLDQAHALDGVIGVERAQRRAMGGQQAGAGHLYEKRTQFLPFRRSA